MSYEFKTTFFQDFSIADCFGLDAIQDTYDRCFKEWRHDIVYLTEFVIVLNLKIFQHYDLGNEEFTALYDRLWRETDDYCMTHLKGKDLDYYIKTTD